jgi:hypothetical protein
VHDARGEPWRCGLPTLLLIESVILASIATETLRLSIANGPCNFDEVSGNQAFDTENCRVTDHADHADHTGSGWI